MSKLKQTVLRAIAIKLEIETHKKYRRVMTKITWFVFICFLGSGFYNSMVKYFDASSLLADAKFVEANVEELPDYVSDKLVLYRYSFVVDGKTYQNNFTASSANYDRYMGENGVNIVYNQKDPSLSGVAVIVENSSSLGGVFKHLAFMFFLGGIGFFVIYLFLTNGIVQPVEEYEDDEDDLEDEEKPDSESHKS